MRRLNHEVFDSTVVIGIGNISKGDDGLGWAFIDALVKEGLSLNTIYRYQLSLEDAELISRYDRVFFVDASIREMEDGFRIKKVFSDNKESFFSHHFPPDVLLDICSAYFQKQPEAWLVEIKGYSFELGDSIGVQARLNLDKTVDSFKKIYDSVPDWVY